MKPNERKAAISCLIMALAFLCFYIFLDGPWHYLIVVGCGFAAALVIIFISSRRAKKEKDRDR